MVCCSLIYIGELISKDMYAFFFCSLVGQVYTVPVLYYYNITGNFKKPPCWSEPEFTILCAIVSCLVHFHVKWAFLWFDIKPHIGKNPLFLGYNFLLLYWTIILPLIRIELLKKRSWFAWKWRQNFNQFFALLLQL